GCSGGRTALTCRNVAMLSRAAERDRSDPRVGTDSVMRMSQHKMVTFVNGNVLWVARSAKRYRGLFSRAAQHLRAWDGLSTAAGGAHVNVVGRWWRQGDHFDWLTLYLNTHGIRPVWRAMIAAVIASIAVVPAVVLVGPTLPPDPAPGVGAPGARARAVS